MKRDSSRLLSSDLREHPFWWERTPRSKEDPPELLESVDVLIVGSGYTGLCAALQTARGGRSTLVIDAAEPGWGCSSRNGGQIGTGIKPDFAALEKEHGRETAYEVHREGQRALSWIGEFIREENIDCDYRVCGRFFGAHTPRHYDKLARKLESQPPGLEMEAFLVPRADQSKEIDTDFYHGGVVQSQHAALDPAAYHHGILGRAKESGVSVVGHTRATLAPLQYFELPVATIFGYLVFNDFPNTLSLIGIMIIIGAGLYMIYRERVTAKQLVTERAAPPI